MNEPHQKTSNFHTIDPMSSPRFLDAARKSLAAWQVTEDIADAWDIVRSTAKKKWQVEVKMVEK